MLVLANPPPHGWVGDPKASGYSREEPCPIKTTLLVMPLNLMRQWQQEIATHLTPGALKVGVYDPAGIGIPGGRRGSGDGPNEGAVRVGDDIGGQAAGGDRGGQVLRRSGRRPCPRSSINDGTIGAGGQQQQGEGGRGRGGGVGEQGAGRGVVVMCRTLDGVEVPMHTCDVCLLSYELLRR
jgi:hypothetical protein